VVFRREESEEGEKEKTRILPATHRGGEAITTRNGHTRCNWRKGGKAVPTTTVGARKQGRKKKGAGNRQNARLESPTCLTQVGPCLIGGLFQGGGRRVWGSCRGRGRKRSENPGGTTGLGLRTAFTGKKHYLRIIKARTLQEGGDLNNHSCLAASGTGLREDGSEKTTRRPVR